MSLPGFAAQITLQYPRRPYRVRTGQVGSHADAQVAAAEVDPCSVDWLAVQGKSLDAAFASIPDCLSGDCTQLNFHLAEAGLASAYHQYCHP